MPLPYLSYSAWDLYNRDPMAYFQQYYVGRVDKPTLKMTLGKIFQEAWCDPKYDYIAELRRVGFTSDYERIMKTALEHPQLVRLPKKNTEKKYTVTGHGLKYPIMAIYDGEGVPPILVENKFGAVWNERRVRESKQLVWYSLVYLIKRGKLPKILLQSVNSKNGIPTHYWIRHTILEVDVLVSEINRVVDKIQAGDFEQ
jgi:hypothetical protein